MYEYIPTLVVKLENQLTELKSLIADIKSVVESPCTSDTIKVERVVKTIKDYGY